MNKLTKVIAVLCSMLIVSGNVSAACKQSNAKGTWLLHVLIWDITDAERPFSGKCKLKVGSNGAISKSKSTCKVYGESPVNVSGGKLILDSQCGVSGKLTTNAGPIKFRAGQMDRSKNSFTILGVDPNDSNSEMYVQGVRR